MDPSRGHVPVLFDEVLAGLAIEPGGRYIDATVGAGGHAEGILRASAPDGWLLALDADRAAVVFAQEILDQFRDRIVVRTANYRHLKQVAVSNGFDRVDGVLFDLGLSSRQLADGGRGFSFGTDGPLDMRFDAHQEQTAADLVNNLSEASLAELLWKYGEERNSRRIAEAIVSARPLTTTRQLADLIAQTVGYRERIHPATRTFQALRIATNDELGALTEALPQALDLLGSGGRLVVMCFHSLEDRLVKRFFQREERDCLCPPGMPICACGHRARLRVITRKPVRPSAAEVSRNPRSRSAKLRIAERLAEETA